MDQHFGFPTNDSQSERAKRGAELPGAEILEYRCNSSTETCHVHICDKWIQVVHMHEILPRIHRVYHVSCVILCHIVSYCVILCHIVSIVSLIGSRRHRLCWSLPDPTRPVSSGVRSQSTLQEKPKETKSEIQEVAGIELRFRND